MVKKEIEKIRLIIDDKEGNYIEIANFLQSILVDGWEVVKRLDDIKRGIITVKKIKVKRIHPKDVSSFLLPGIKKIMRSKEFQIINNK